MKNVPPAEFVLDSGAKEDIAGTVANLRNEDYSVENRFANLNYIAELPKPFQMHQRRSPS